MFSKPAIIGLCADTNTGKSMLIYHYLTELSKGHTFSTYTYGLRLDYPKATQIFSIEELEQIEDSVVFVDEMGSLFDLENRKVRKQIENTIRLINHNNNVLFLCGLAENWKKFLSAKPNVFIFKKTTLSDLINGSRVKNVIMAYKGVKRGSAVLNLPINEALVFNGTHYTKARIPYIKKYDSKRDNKNILVKRVKKCANRVRNKVVEAGNEIKCEVNDVAKDTNN